MITCVYKVLSKEHHLEIEGCKLLQDLIHIKFLCIGSFLLGGKIRNDSQKRFK